MWIGGVDSSDFRGTHLIAADSPQGELSQLDAGPMLDTINKRLKQLYFQPVTLLAGGGLIGSMRGSTPDGSSRGMGSSRRVHPEVEGACSEDEQKAPDSTGLFGRGGKCIGSALAVPRAMQAR